MSRLRKGVVIVAVFALGIVVEAHVRRTSSGGYGRLFGQQVAAHNDDLQPRKIEVVPEAPVRPSVANNTVLTAPSAVGQTAAATLPAAAPPAAAEPQTTRPSRSRFAIVGDANGVSVVLKGQQAP